MRRGHSESAQLSACVELKCKSFGSPSSASLVQDGGRTLELFLLVSVVLEEIAVLAQASGVVERVRVPALRRELASVALVVITLLAHPFRVVLLVRVLSLSN